MPTKPPHQVSSLAFQNPDSPSISRNANMRNEPNSTRRIYETNPIYPTPTILRPKNTKRTQLPAPSCLLPHAPILRNEPTFRTGTACRAPITRNEPNLPHAHRPTVPPTQKYQTNPIASPLLLFSSPLLPFSPSPLLPFCPYHPPKMRNEPNLNKSEWTLNLYGTRAYGKINPLEC